MTHRAWLVDLDGTLYAPKPLKWAMAAELLMLGLPQAGAIRVFRREHEKPVQSTQLRSEVSDVCGGQFVSP